MAAQKKQIRKAFSDNFATSSLDNAGGNGKKTMSTSGVCRLPTGTVRRSADTQPRSQTNCESNALDNRLNVHHMYSVRWEWTPWNGVESVAEKRKVSNEISSDWIE